MKKHSIISSACVLAVFITSLSTTVSANSIWNEKPESFSLSKYMPIIVGGTLIVEALIILLLSDIKRIVNVSFAVLVANVVSFIVPRLAWGFINGGGFYTGLFTYGNAVTDWLVTFLYLAVTLLIELPIVWYMLRHFTKKIAKLLLVTAAANVFTTVILAILQQLLYNSLIS
ncbi:MAG: hypothetical protein IJ725_01890 [Ruminococcus sp.]|nr:hypothetical protein [Ruminococcus sp.]